MPSRELPIHPNLEQYRKQAKELLKAWRARDTQALQRANQHSVRFGRASADPSRRSLKLADAQFVIAREHGFENWRKFASHIQVTTASDRLAEGAVAVIQLDIATDEMQYTVSRSALMGCAHCPAHEMEQYEFGISKPDSVFAS